MNQFFRFVETDLQDSGSEMLVTRVIPSLLASARHNGFNEITGATLSVWAADMLLHGLKTTTVRRYLGTLHTAYLSYIAGQPADTPACSTHEVSDEPATEVPDTSLDTVTGPGEGSAADPFPPLLERLATLTVPPLAALFENTTLIPRILPRLTSPGDPLPAALFLYLLYDPRATLAGVIHLRHGDPIIDLPQITEILEALPANPRSKYIFPLGQGKQREPRISRDIIASIHRLLTDAGMHFGPAFSRESVTTLWITSAINGGLSVSDIRSLVANPPAEFAYLNLLPAATLDPYIAESLLERVANHINDRTPRWFVMKLRKGRTPDDIHQRLEDLQPRLLSDLSFYYPTRKVLVKDKGKRLYQDQPFIPDLLFFRTYADRVRRLFALIGDLAWCFRTSNRPDAPYSTISFRDMAEFQRHIGALSPDVEVQLLTDLPPVALNDQVRIIGGGILDGYHGIVTKILDHDGTLTYALRLSDTAYIRWSEVHLPAAFVEPLRE